MQKRAQMNNVQLNESFQSGHELCGHCLSQQKKDTENTPEASCLFPKTKHMFLLLGASSKWMRKQAPVGVFFNKYCAKPLARFLLGNLFMYQVNPFPS